MSPPGGGSGCHLLVGGGGWVSPPRGGSGCHLLVGGNGCHLLVRVMGVTS